MHTVRVVGALAPGNILLPYFKVSPLFVCFPSRNRVQYPVRCFVLVSQWAQGSDLAVSCVYSRHVIQVQAHIDLEPRHCYPVVVAPL